MPKEKRPAIGDCVIVEPSEEWIEPFEGVVCQILDAQFLVEDTTGAWRPVLNRSNWRLKNGRKKNEQTSHTGRAKNKKAAGGSEPARYGTSAKGRPRRVVNARSR